LPRPAQRSVHIDLDDSKFKWNHETMNQDLQDLSITTEQLLDTMAEGVVVVDKTGHIRFWNPGRGVSARTSTTGFEYSQLPCRPCVTAWTMYL